MPRMTKAERLALEDQQLAEQEVKEAAAYPSRMICAMEQAQLYYFDIRVRNGKFGMFDERGVCDGFVFAPTWDRVSQYNLEAFESQLLYLEAEKQERIRRQQVKEVALAKLTEEERKVLFSKEDA